MKSRSVLSEGRTNDVEFASTEFEHYIQEADAVIWIVQAVDAGAVPR